LIAVSAEGLRKVYKGRVEALKGIDLKVNKGEIFSLLGPNGAGKTTTIGILSCVLKPTAGKVQVLGLQVPRQCAKVREIIGVVPQKFMGFSDLTVRENVEYFVRIYGGKREQVDEILSSLSLERYSQVRYKRLSGGLIRRVAIACALAGDPEVLFMDEPSVGLDPKSRRELWKIVKDVKGEGRTVLMTTHYMEEADQLCHRIAIINRGKIVAVGTPAELKAKAGGTVVVFELSQGFDGENLKGVKGVLESQLKDGTLSVTLDDESHVVDLLRAIDLKKVKSVKILKPSLDTAFLKLTGSTIEEAEVDYRKFYAMIRRATR